MSAASYTDRVRDTLRAQLIMYNAVQSSQQPSYRCNLCDDYNNVQALLELSEMLIQCCAHVCGFS